MPLLFGASLIHICNKFTRCYLCVGEIFAIYGSAANLTDSIISKLIFSLYWLKPVTSILKYGTLRTLVCRLHINISMPFMRNRTLFIELL
jgi:hypothetical protein